MSSSRSARLLVLAIVVASPCGNAGEPAAPVLRREYVVVSRDLRLTWLLDTAGLSERTSQGFILVSQQGKPIAVVKVKIDGPSGTRQSLLRLNQKDGWVEYTRDRKDPRLSDEERRLGMGVLRTPLGEAHLLPDDANLRTVRIRADELVSGLAGRNLETVRFALEVVLGCGLEIPRGDILSILFADVLANRKQLSCAEQPEAASPVPAVDRLFTALEPGVGEMLRRDVKLVPPKTGER